MKVALFVKPQCSLCARALDLLRDAQEVTPFELNVHNVLERDTWFASYRYEIPVVLVNGVKKLRLHFSAEALAEALEARERRPRAQAATS